MPITEQILRLLDVAREPRPRDELRQLLGLKRRPHFQEAYLEPLIRTGCKGRGAGHR